jgi:superfamily II DNA or RNA helicase
MSIKIPLNQLTDTERLDILTNLTFRITDKNDNVTMISPYHIVDDSIFVPYAWGIEKGFKPRPREDFPNTQVEFQGSLRESQKLVKKKAIDSLNSTGSVLLSLHVGFGKSVLGIYICCKLKLRTMIVVNRLVLANQWVELLKKLCLNATIQFLTAKSVVKECDFYVVNALNIPKLAPEFLQTIGIVLGDEIHLLCAKKLYQSFFHMTPKYVIGLSATPYRSDGLGKLIDLYFGKEQIARQLVRNHIVFPVMTGFELEFTYNQHDGSMNWNSVLESQSTHPERNAMIVDIICENSDRNVLVLVKRIAHGFLLEAALKNRGQSVTNLLGSSIVFDQTARILVATVSKVGVGFSHDKLDMLVMAADLEAYAIQFIGRVFRTETVEPIIYDFIDELGTLKKHYATRKKVYKEIGATFSKIK